MNKRPFATIFVLLIIPLMAAACGQTPVPSLTPTTLPTETPTPTFTPDPCGQGNIDAEIQKVHRLMRQFDDAATLSSYLTRDQLKPTIEEMQRIRRAAEDLTVPICLKSMRELQVSHMNTFIQTLLVFMGGADQEAVNQGIVLSRQLHDLYMAEMAKQQGVILPFTPTAMPSPEVTRNPKATPVPQLPTPTVPVVTNMGPGGINIRLTPSLDGQPISILAVGQSALALGQTEDGSWVMIEVPGQNGQTAWVYAALVQLGGPMPLSIIPVE
jgi:hypothetical protein